MGLTCACDWLLVALWLGDGVGATAITGGVALGTEPCPPQSVESVGQVAAAPLADDGGGVTWVDPVVGPVEGTGPGGGPVTGEATVIRPASENIIRIECRI